MSQELKHRSQIFHLHSVSYSSGKLPYLRAFMGGFIENVIALVFLRTSFCDGLIASGVWIQSFSCLNPFVFGNGSWAFVTHSEPVSGLKARGTAAEKPLPAPEKPPPPQINTQTSQWWYCWRSLVSCVTKNSSSLTQSASHLPTARGVPVPLAAGFAGKRRGWDLCRASRQGAGQHQDNNHAFITPL